ncbi:MAG: hypothetical protein CVU46_12625 [Chloroflexi bacterium HGW-Chloroflexi-8]|jgi:hypothetical protein|nr:MAG: hypothetical protein CVU46_12625 [Chloroflexi bacterium HGW-Chloroflexi-8]
MVKTNIARDIILIVTDTCETYRLQGLKGELDPIFIPLGIEYALIHPAKILKPAVCQFFSALCIFL